MCVPSKAEEYRRKAEEAQVKAETTRDLSAKPMYEDIAGHYRYLAEQQDRMDAYERRSKK